MSEYLLRRLVYFVPLLFLVTVVTFSVALLLPGDPALAYIGEANMRDKVMYETMRKELGLDQPIPTSARGWVITAMITGEEVSPKPPKRATSEGTPV